MLHYLNRPWAYLATAVFVGLIGVYTRKYPRRTGTSCFRVIIGLWFAWALAAANQTMVQTQELRYGLWVLQAVFALSIAPLQLLLSLEYTGNEKQIARRSLLLLVLPASWAPILLMILAQILPLVGYAVFNPRWITISLIHLLVIFSNFSAVAYFVALYNYGLLQVIPVARDKVISHLPYAMIVLDADNRLVDFNPAAQALPGLHGKLVLRKPAAKVLGEWWGRMSPLFNPAPVSQEVTLHTAAGQQHFNIYRMPLLQANGCRVGHVFLLSDVTQAHQAQQRHQLTW